MDRTRMTLVLIACLAMTLMLSPLAAAGHGACHGSRCVDEEPTPPPPEEPTCLRAPKPTVSIGWQGLTPYPRVGLDSMPLPVCLSPRDLLP